MNIGPSPLDEFDAVAISELLETVVAGEGSGRFVVYRQKRGRQLQPTAGVAMFTDVDERTVRAYSGAEQKRAEPGADYGVLKIIIRAADLQSPSPLTPRAGDTIEDGGDLYGVDSVDYGEIGQTTIYYLLNVTLKRSAS